MRPHHYTLLIAFLFFHFSSFAQTGSQVSHASKRTGWIGGCTAVVLPPLTDESGYRRWFAATAGHCYSGSDRTLAIEYPEKRSYRAREIERLGNFSSGRTWSPEILILELLDVPHEGIPYAEIDLRDPDQQNGVEAFTTAYPVRPVSATGSPIWPPARMTYKSATVRSFVTDRGAKGLEFKAEIWGGNSGGPLWSMESEPRLVGIASSTNKRVSHFTPTDHLLRAFAAAAEAVQYCPDGNCRPCPKCGKVHSPDLGLLRRLGEHRNKRQPDSIRDGGYKSVPDPALAQAVADIQAIKERLDAIDVSRFVTQDEALALLGQLPDLSTYVKRDELPSAPDIDKPLAELRSLLDDLRTRADSDRASIRQDLEQLHSLTREDRATFDQALEQLRSRSIDQSSEIEGRLSQHGDAIGDAVGLIEQLRSEVSSDRSSISEAVSLIARLRERVDDTATEVGELGDPPWWNRVSTVWSVLGGGGVLAGLAGLLLGRRRSRLGKELAGLSTAVGEIRKGTPLTKDLRSRVDKLGEAVASATSQIGDQLALSREIHDQMNQRIDAIVRDRSGQSREVAGGASHFREGSTATDSRETAAVPVDTEEAREYLSLAEREGYSSLNDALFGRLAAEELENIEASRLATEEERRIADGFRRRVEERFNRLMPAVRVTQLTRPSGDDLGYLKPQ